MVTTKHDTVPYLTFAMTLSNVPGQNALLTLSSSASAFFERLRLTMMRLFKYPRRSALPVTLAEWKNIEESQEDGLYPYIWNNLEAFLNEHQFTLFHRFDNLNQNAPDLPAPSNYIYCSANNIYRSGQLVSFCVPTACHHAARKNKRHYVIRVMRVAEQGLNHLQILRLLSNTVPDNLLSNNYILPMVEEMTYEDISFGVFPLVCGQLQVVLMPMSTKCTLEDALHLIMQAIEGIIYLHGKNIAHRDLFTDNILVDFYPESLLGQQWVRPRAYISDFETAIHFADDVKPSERLVSGFPFEDFGVEEYNRVPPAPELLLPDTQQYCPFRLDMFQFGTHLNKYLQTTGCDELDRIWPPLMSANPTDRPTPHQLFETLGDFLNKTPPRDLQRPWTYDPSAPFGPGVSLSEL